VIKINLSSMGRYARAKSYLKRSYRGVVFDDPRVGGRGIKVGSGVSVGDMARARRHRVMSGLADRTKVTAYRSAIGTTFGVNRYVFNTRGGAKRGAGAYGGAGAFKGRGRGWRKFIKGRKR
jgi:hypothetical protein